MPPDVLQAGSFLQLNDALVRAFCGCLLVPTALGFVAYVWICLTTRRR